MPTDYEALWGSAVRDQNATPQALAQATAPEPDSSGVMDYLATGASALSFAFDIVGRPARTLVATGDFGRAFDSILDPTLASSGRDVLDSIGIDPFGEVDGKFDWMDVPDFILETGVEIALDPLTYLSGGLSKLGQKVASGGSTAIEGLSKISASATARATTAKLGMDFSMDAMKPVLGELLGDAAAINKADVAAKFLADTGQEWAESRLKKGGVLTTRAERLAAGESGMKLGLPFGIGPQFDLPSTALAKPIGAIASGLDVLGGVGQAWDKTNKTLSIMGKMANWFREGTGNAAMDQISQFSNVGGIKIAPEIAQVGEASRVAVSAGLNTKDLDEVSYLVERMLSDETVATFAQRAEKLGLPGADLKASYLSRYGTPEVNHEKLLKTLGSPEKVEAAQTYANTLQAVFSSVREKENAAFAMMKGTKVGKFGDMAYSRAVKAKKGLIEAMVRTVGPETFADEASGALDVLGKAFRKPKSVAQVLESAENLEETVRKSGALGKDGGDAVKAALETYVEEVKIYAQVPSYLPRMVSEDALDVMLTAERQDPGIIRKMMDGDRNFMTVEEANKAISETGTAATAGLRVPGSLTIKEIASAMKAGYNGKGLEGAAAEIHEAMMLTGKYHETNPAAIMSKRMQKAATVITDAEFKTNVRNVFGEAMPLELKAAMAARKATEKSLKKLTRATSEKERRAILKDIRLQDATVVGGALQDVIKKFGTDEMDLTRISEHVVLGEKRVARLQARKVKIDGMVGKLRNAEVSAYPGAVKEVEAIIKRNVERVNDMAKPLATTADKRKLATGLSEMEHLGGMAELRFEANKAQELIDTLREQMDNAYNSIVEDVHGAGSLGTVSRTLLSGNEAAEITKLMATEGDTISRLKKIRNVLENTRKPKNLNALAHKMDASILKVETDVTQTIARQRAEALAGRAGATVKGAKAELREIKGERRDVLESMGIGKKASKDLTKKVSALEEEAAVLSARDSLNKLDAQIGAYNPGAGVSKASALGMATDVDDYLLPAEIAQIVAKGRDVMRMPETWKGITKPLRFFNQWWKQHQLAVPGTFLRNVAGNFMLMAQGEGLTRNSTKYFTQIIKAQRAMSTSNVVGKAKSMKALDQAVTLASGQKISMKQFIDEATRLGVTDSGMFGADLKELTQQLTGKSGGKFRIPGVGWMTKANEWAENTSKLTYMLGRIEQGDSLEAAALGAQKYLFNYRHVSPAVQLGRSTGLAPFVAWTSKNLPLQTEMMLTKPGQFTALMHAKDVLEGGMPELSPEERRQFMYDQWGVRVSQADDGSYNFITAHGLIPAADITAFADVVRDPTQVFEFLTSLTGGPVKAGMEAYVFDKNLFTKQTISKMDGALSVIKLPGVKEAGYFQVWSASNAHFLRGAIGRPVSITESMAKWVNGEIDPDTNEPYEPGKVGAFSSAWKPFKESQDMTAFDIKNAIRRMGSQRTGLKSQLNRARREGQPEVVALTMQKLVKLDEKKQKLLRGLAKHKKKDTFNGLFSEHTPAANPQ